MSVYECLECKNGFELSLNVCPVCETPKTIERPKLIAVAAITGEFITDKGSSKLESKVGSPWPIDDDICYKFISEVERKFKNRTKFHSYYDKDTESDKSSTASKLISYINESKSSEKQNEEFKKLVHILLRDLVDSAIETGTHKVSGGNIVFMHYKNNDDSDLGRLLAVMVSKKDGFNFNDDLIPTDAAHINLDALRQAALFDLTLFDEVYPDIPESDTYLKFIQGNSQGAFFKKAFGCKVIADNGRSVSQFYEAILSFQETKKLPETFYDNAKVKVDEAFEKAAKTKSPVSLKELSNIVESELKSDSNLRGTFLHYVNTNFEVNHHIEPTKNDIEVENWLEVAAYDESFKAKIYRKKIGECGSGEPVEYDIEHNKLILKITDEDAQDVLKKLVTKNES